MLGLLVGTVWALPNLQPKFTGDESFAESYTAIVDLEDGTYILAQILFTNAGFGDQKAGCRALVVPKGTGGVNASLQLDAGEWQGTPKKLPEDAQECRERAQGLCKPKFGLADSDRIWRDRHKFGTHQISNMLSTTNLGI